MSILVLQITIKQWDKSQRTPKHSEDRAKIENHYPIVFPPALYAFDKQCVIDQHGDDLSGNRIRYSQLDNDMIQLDRFQISLSTKMLEYTGSPDSDMQPRTIGLLDNRWIQCKYDWRYSVYEGGFYYWLYEEITVNAIYVSTLEKDVFMHDEPASIIELGS